MFGDFYRAILVLILGNRLDSLHKILNWPCVQNGFENRRETEAKCITNVKVLKMISSLVQAHSVHKFCQVAQLHCTAFFENWERHRKAAIFFYFCLLTCRQLQVACQDLCLLTEKNQLRCK